MDKENLIWLCWKHHAEVHTIGRWTFARKYGLIERLKIEVDKEFKINAKATSPAIVRWPPGTRQEPHADKEFHEGPNAGTPNAFPYYDMASIFYINDNYVATAKTHSLKGEPLTPSSEGVLGKGQYYVFTPHKDSFDSRYQKMGWVNQEQIIGVAYPLW